MTPHMCPLNPRVSSASNIVSIAPAGVLWNKARIFLFVVFLVKNHCVGKTQHIPSAWRFNKNACLLLILILSLSLGYPYILPCFTKIEKYFYQYTSYKQFYPSVQKCPNVGFLKPRLIFVFTTILISLMLNNLTSC